MGSGGDLLVTSVYSLLHSSDIARAGIDRRQQFRSIQAPEGGLRELEHFPDDRGSGVDFLEAFGCGRAQPDGRERGLHDIGGSEVAPMFAWELVEGDEPLPIGEQALDGL